MIKKGKKSVVILVLLISIILFGAVQASAKESVEKGVSPSVTSYQKCYSLDMVFLIDQSRSMNDPDYIAPNDPYNNRIKAVKAIIELLEQNQLYTCPNVSHRVAVISFWNSAQVDLPFTTLPNTKENWENSKEGIFEKIQPLQEDGTNPIEAFKLASELWTENPAPDDPNNIRKRAILLITDGHPCPTGMVCSNDTDLQEYMGRLNAQIETDFVFSENLLSREIEIGRRLALYNNDFSLLPDEELTTILSQNPVTDEEFEESTYVHILALNDAEEYSDIAKNGFGGIVGFHGGNFLNLDTYDATDLAGKIQIVTSRLTMIKYIVAGCGEKPIQPYYARILLHVFGNTEDTWTTISLGDPDNPAAQMFKGAGVQPGDEDVFGFTGEYSDDGVNENYVFNKPPGGMWHFEASVCESIRIIYKGLLPSNFVVEEPTHALPLYDLGTSTNYDPENPFKIAYRISGELENTDETADTVYLTPDPYYALEVIAEVTDPYGTKTQLILEHDDSDPGLWRSTEGLPTNVTGEYEVSIVSAKTECVDAESFDCVPGQKLDLLSGKVDPAVEAPLGTTKYQVNPVDHFTFGIVSPRENGKAPVHEALYKGYKTAPVEIIIQLKDDSDNPISGVEIFGSEEAFEKGFSPELEIDEKKFNAVLDSEVDAKDKSKLHLYLDAGMTNGDAEVEIALTGDYQYDKYLVREKEDTQTFKRQDPFLRHIAFLIGVGVVIALAIVGLIFYIIVHKRKALRGYLEFTSTSPDGKSYKVPVSKSWDTTKVSLPTVLGISGKAKVTSMDENSFKIMIEYKVKDTKHTMAVTSGQAYPMKGGIPYRVSYAGGENPIGDRRRSSSGSRGARSGAAGANRREKDTKKRNDRRNTNTKRKR